MRSVLVSGPPDEATAVADALRRQGFDTYGLDLPPQLGTGALGRHPLRPVDCYVQLAPEGRGGAGSPTRTLLRRVEAVSVVTPLLARDATVLMVADDYDRRRRDALKLMAEAALTDAGGGAARVVVLDEPFSPHTMTGVARRRQANRNRVSLVEVAPELPYADWRNEVFSLTGRDDTLIREWIASSVWEADLGEAFAQIVGELRL